MKSRSISAARPKMVAYIFDCIEPFITIAFFTTWIATSTVVAAFMIFSTCSVDRARREISATTSTSPGAQRPRSLPILLQNGKNLPLKHETPCAI